VNRIIPKLKRERNSTSPGEPAQLTGDFVVDEKHRNITVTDDGWVKVEGLLGIGKPSPILRIGRSSTTFETGQSHALYRKTWNTSSKTAKSSSSTIYRAHDAGRRWSDGLHQALKPRSSRSNARTRRLRRSLSRIISACSRSWRA